MPHMSRLPTAVRRIVEMIHAPVMAFDRVKLHFDHAAPSLPFDEVDSLCRGGLKHVPIIGTDAQKFHPERKYYVELFQPGRDALRLLYQAAKGRYTIRPYMLEVAVDWITDDREEAKMVRDFILGHMWVPHLTYEVKPYEQTWYYAPRATGPTQGDSSPKRSIRLMHNVVLYADKRSKLASPYFGRPCCHLEHRFFGANACADIGASCLGDLAQFRHHAFWREHLRLAMMLSKTELGRFLAPSRVGVSGTALRKRANACLQKYEIDGAFVLQNLWRHYGEIKRFWTPLANGIVLLR
jgi:hypothetical protein